MRARLLIALPLLVVPAWLACTGSDPQLVPAPPQIPAADAASSDDASSEAIPPLGIFLTSQLYGVDFLVGHTADRERYVDELCADAARVAGLASWQSYRSVIAVGKRDDDDTKELERLLALRTNAASGQRWCVIAPGRSGGAPAPSCQAGGNIFDSPDDFLTGPRNAIVSDERGQSPHGLSSFFFSGYVVPLADASISAGFLRNCGQWTLTTETGATGDDDLYGAGIAEPPPGGLKIFGWAGRNGAPCSGGVKLPLLCMQAP